MAKEQSKAIAAIGVFEREFRHYHTRVYFAILAACVWAQWGLFTPSEFNNSCSSVLIKKADWCVIGIGRETFFFLPEAALLGLLSWSLFKFRKWPKERGAYKEGVLLYLVPAYLAFRIATVRQPDSAFLAFFHDRFYETGLFGTAALMAGFLWLIYRNSYVPRASALAEEVSPEVQEERPIPSPSEKSEDGFRSETIASVREVLPAILTDIAYKHPKFARVTVSQEGNRLPGALSIRSADFVGATTVFVELSIHPDLLSEIRGLADFDWTLGINSRGRIKGFVKAEWKSEGGENGLVLTVKEYSIDFSQTFRYPHLLERHPDLKHAMDVAIGKLASGKDFVFNLAKMPHLLVAGTTGRGKSVGMNNVIISLLKNVLAGFPIDKIILIDPKMVEFAPYDGLPKVYVVTESQKALNALKWCVAEMERRYMVLKTAKARNIEGYREKGGDMGYLVVVIDELADFMMGGDKKEIETCVVRIGQKARAAGMHLVVATQRPSVDVVTGLIKANVPARLGFGTASDVDSRVIADSDILAGLPRGHAKLITADQSVSYLKTYFVNDDVGGDLEQFIELYRKNFAGDTELPYPPENFESGEDTDVDNDAIVSDEDPKIISDAVNFAKISGKVSASLLQRHMRLGYSRAARLVDILEEMGVVGPADGSKPRDVIGFPGASVDSDETSDAGASVDSRDNRGRLAKWQEILSAMRNCKDFDEFETPFVFFRYIFENDGYPSRQELRKFGSKHGISNPVVDFLIKSLKSGGLLRTEEAKKCNVLAVPAAEMTPEHAGALYEAIRNSIK